MCPNLEIFKVCHITNMKVLKTKLGNFLKNFHLKLNIVETWDVCLGVSREYVFDTNGGGRVGGNGMSEYNIQTPSNNDLTFKSLENLK